MCKSMPTFLLVRGFFIWMRMAGTNSEWHEEWISGNKSSLATWGTTIDTNSVYHAVSLQSPQEFSETSELANWGTLYHAMKQVRLFHILCILQNLQFLPSDRHRHSRTGRAWMQTVALCSNQSKSWTTPRIQAIVLSTSTAHPTIYYQIEILS